jgi:hypothetical protein
MFLLVLARPVLYLLAIPFLYVEELLVEESLGEHMVTYSFSPRARRFHSRHLDEPRR